MDFNIFINGREPKPRVINVKQYTSNTDRVIFTFDALPEQGSCYLLWGNSRSKLPLDGNNALWDISQVYTQKSGSFNFQLETEGGDADNSVWRSDLMLLIVSQSLERGDELKETAGSELKGMLALCGVIEDSIKGEAMEVDL